MDNKLKYLMSWLQTVKMDSAQDYINLVKGCVKKAKSYKTHANKITRQMVDNLTTVEKIVSLENMLYVENGGLK